MARVLWETVPGSSTAGAGDDGLGAQLVCREGQAPGQQSLGVAVPLVSNLMPEGYGASYAGEMEPKVLVLECNSSHHI